jgi:hypothetical protein
MSLFTTLISTSNARRNCRCECHRRAGVMGCPPCSHPSAAECSARVSDTELDERERATADMAPHRR